EADHQEALVRGGDEAGDEGVRRVHRGHPLKVDVRPRELRTDVVHVVGHATQDRVHYRLGRVAAQRAIAMDLLDPLEVDDRHYSHQQIGVAGDIHFVRHHTAVQPFV